MQNSSWLLATFAALAASSTDAANAAFMASTSQCSSVDTCYEGGASSTSCTVSSGGCPPCITFADDGCYVKVDGACPFGVDCSSVWGGSTSTSSGSSASSTTTSSATGSTTSSSTTTTTSSSTGSSTSTTAGTTSKSGSGTSGTAGVSSDSPTASSTSGGSSSSSSSATAGDSSGGGSDMSVVFAIIGAAIGVIAVAVIFLTLVRRSKAAHDDDEDDMANTPPAFSKNPVVQAPHSTTGSVTYASYSNRAGGVGSGTGAEIDLDMPKSGGVSMNAVSYYNQQPPQNSTAPSPRVAGRAIPSQPVGMNQNTGMARPYGASQNFGQMGASGLGASGLGASGFGASGLGVTSGMGASGGGNQAPPPPVQHIPMGGVAPSPHSRRESYEF